MVDNNSFHRWPLSDVGVTCTIQQEMTVICSTSSGERHKPYFKKFTLDFSLIASRDLIRTYKNVYELCMDVTIVIKYELL